MRAVIAPGEDTRPALALVNSRRNSPEGPVDELATAASLGAWLRGHGLAAGGRVARPELGAMRELREAVRELLLARIEDRAPDPAAVEAVNAASAAAPAAPRLVWTASGTPCEESEFPNARGTALARALLATDAIDLVTGPDHANLRASGSWGAHSSSPRP